MVETARRDEAAKKAVTDKRYFFVFCVIIAAVGSTFAAGAWTTYGDVMARGVIARDAIAEAESTELQYAIDR